MSRMQSITIYLTPKQLETLRLLSRRTRVPMGVYVREGVELLLHSEAAQTEGSSRLPPLEYERGKIR